jgi:hypothetical protein
MFPHTEFSLLVGLREAKQRTLNKCAKIRSGFPIIAIGEKLVSSQRVRSLSKQEMVFGANLGWLFPVTESSLSASENQ